MMSHAADISERTASSDDVIDVSVVVPLLDEAENLRPLTDEIRAALSDGPRWELIFVDDGSTDDSPAVLDALRADDPRIRVLRQPRNLGQSAALAAGFDATRGLVVVTLDADLQNDPADIPTLLAALDDPPGGGPKADVVSGIRQNRRDGWVRLVASRIANRVRHWVLGDGVHDVGCSLKAYRRHFVEDLPCFDGLHRFLPALLVLQGARIVEVPVHHRPRHRGDSKYTINNRLWRGLYDLVGVRWLQARWVDRRLAREVTEASTVASGGPISESSRVAGSPAKTSKPTRTDETSPGDLASLGARVAQRS